MNTKNVDENTRRAAEKFADNMEKYPIAEQIAVSSISQNVLNGCSWEFVRNNSDTRSYKEDFKGSQTCTLKEVTYSHERKITGYLIEMNLQRLVNILSKEALGVFDKATLDKALEHRKEAVLKCANIMKKGYSGRVGVFCTNDSPTITVDGKSYPAFAVTLSEMCDICSKMGYGFKVGSSIRSPQEIKNHLDGVIKACIVAPSSNALFIDIAPMR